MKIAIAIIVVIATLLTTILWSCLCVSARADRQMEQHKDSKK